MDFRFGAGARGFRLLKSGTWPTRETSTLSGTQHLFLLMRSRFRAVLFCWILLENRISDDSRLTFFSTFRCFGGGDRTSPVRLRRNKA